MVDSAIQRGWWNKKKWDTEAGWRILYSKALTLEQQAEAAVAGLGPPFGEGQAVEARLGDAKGRVKSAFKPGTVAKANPDGTYVVRYADGGRERAVAEALIRPVAPPLSLESEA